MTIALQRYAGIIATAALAVSLLIASPLAASANNDSAKLGNRVEIAITEGGNVLVRGAKVTAISGSTITAQTSFGAVSTSWTIQTDSTTGFYNARGQGGALASIAVGDTLSFAGAMNGAFFTVKATAVKDWTPVASEATVRGVVSALNASALSLTLDKGNKKTPKTVTVQFNSATQVTLNGTASAFGSLAVSDGLKVTGTLSADGTQLTATKAEATRPASQEDRKFLKIIKGWFDGKHSLNFNFR